MDSNKNDMKPPHDEVLIRVENAGKIFCRDLRKSLLYGVYDGVGDLVPGLGRKYDAQGNPILRKEEFWANHEISFELRRGECLGLIGRNGAGKTTLLKMLNGLIRPDTGHIEVKGRVGAIIALNAGFNPLLTGRENVYIAGSIRGLSKKEIDAHYDSIVDFAELHEFMESPVQNYSSGMQVRLGFAIASAMEPDILIVDEVLAVGDFSFRMKCQKRISSLLRSSAVIFVSHRINQVKKICSKALYLESGRVVAQGDLQSTIDLYESDEKVPTGEHYVDTSFNHIDISLEEHDISFGSSIDVSVSYDLKDSEEIASLRIVFFDYTGTPVAEWSSANHSTIMPEAIHGEGCIDIKIQNIRLKPGTYSIRLYTSNSKNNHLCSCNIGYPKPISISGNERMLHLYQL